MLALEPFLGDYYVPEDEEVDLLVHRLHRNRAGGPSGIQAENLWSWLEAAIREDSSDPTQWEKVAGMIQSAFCRVHLTEECAWKTVLLIPKGNGDL